MNLSTLNSASKIKKKNVMLHFRCAIMHNYILIDFFVWTTISIKFHKILIDFDYQYLIVLVIVVFLFMGFFFTNFDASSLKQLGRHFQ